MTDVAGHSMVAMMKLAADNDATADARTGLNEDKVIDVFVAADVFAEGHEVGVVVNDSGHS